MGFLTDRAGLIFTYLGERGRHGLPEVVGSVDHEVLFLVDGVGGFQLCASMIRRALREEESPIGTILFDWQTRLRADIWSDLIRIRRNRWMAARLARRILAFRRSCPAARIHLFAVSAGTGIAVMACERLKRAGLIDTLILACPALSPTYDLSGALRAVQRCYALISRRDTAVLGLGTRLFGTVDRRFTSGAGRVGFHRPGGLSEVDSRYYDRLREIHWTPALKAEGNLGGHGGWVNVRFLRRHLLPLLRGEPCLPLHQVAAS